MKDKLVREYLGLVDTRGEFYGTKMIGNRPNGNGLLERIDKQLGNIEDKLDEKVDVDELEELRNIVKSLLEHLDVNLKYVCEGYEIVAKEKTK